MEFTEPLGASYRLGDLLGRGAAGEVRLARDTRDQAVLAAKILLPEHAQHPQLVERFVRERSLLMELRHPNLVAIRDLVVEGDRLAIVMDYLDGGTLRDVLRERGTLSPSLASGIVAEVLDATAAAHAAGIVHRDIKPDNVLLEKGWEDLHEGSVRVSDFGIASILSARTRSTTGLLGTPEYMAPEMITTGEAGPAVDVYAAGILLYELLAGRTPFAGPGTDFTVAYRHVSAEVPRLDLPPALSSLLGQLLAKAPAARPSAAEAAVRLRRTATSVSDVPALSPQSSPDEFVESERPATAVRGIKKPPSDETTRPAELVLDPAPEVGERQGATIVRPMPLLPQPAEVPTLPAMAGDQEARPWYRQPRWLAAACAGVLSAAAVLWLAVGGTGSTKPTESAQATTTALQNDQTLPTGLTIRRTAEVRNGRLTLTLNYSAQKAPLSGPFLEVIGPAKEGGACPSVAWQGNVTATHHKASATGITAPCGWALDRFDLPAKGSLEVTAEVGLSAMSADELQQWLNAQADATSQALRDPEVKSTAYAVQRLQNVEVTVPASTVSGTTIPLTVVPVWPSGRDSLNLLYRSPAVGKPSSLLQAVAGDEKGIRFSDGCNGALSVSSDGLIVTAVSIAPECTVRASVGNFTDVTSQSFPVVARGG